MAAFAKTSDLEARWRALKDDEAERAEALLEDAATIIEAECERAGVTLDHSSSSTASRLKTVSCEMVKRAMVASVDQSAVTQGSMTVGPFSQSLTYANPTGDLYLTKRERRMLGIGARIGFASPWGDAQ